MGDYNAIIVSARIKKVQEENLKSFEEEVLNKLSLCDSAYHQTAPFIRIENSDYGDHTYLNMVTQAKYNHGVDEFISWLRPMVTGGLGPNDAWLINFSEYYMKPDIEYLDPIEREY